MLAKEQSTLVKKAGLMAALLGAGDTIHLLPRSYVLWTTEPEINAAALEIGRLVTFITMTIFYLILYYVWRDRCRIQGRAPLAKTIWTLAMLRIALYLLPQNQWLAYRQSLFFGVLRNIPFAIMGVIIIVLFTREAGREPAFQFMPLAVALSFGFHLPAVLFSGTVPAVDVLRIPKVTAYVWIVWMGWQLYRQPQIQI